MIRTNIICTLSLDLKKKNRKEKNDDNNAVKYVYLHDSQSEMYDDFKMTGFFFCDDLHKRLVVIRPRRYCLKHFSYFFFRYFTRLMEKNEKL